VPPPCGKFTPVKGYPRLINTLCDHALLCGYGANLAVIDDRVIKECSVDLSVALDLDDGLEKPHSGRSGLERG